MAGGNRYKWQGTFISFVTAYGTPTAVTAITQANPPVVTSVAHGLLDGDVVKMLSVVGMTEVNSEIFMVDKLTADTFALLNTDATGYGAYVSGGTFSKATFTNLCELTSWNRAGEEAPQIPANSICSTEKEYETGLSGQGTVTAGFNFAPLTAVQVQLEAVRQSGAKMGWKVILPKAGGTITQLGFVTNTSEQSGNDQLWAGTVNLRATGPRAIYATP